MREIAVQQSASWQIAPNELADALPPLPSQQANASPWAPFALRRLGMVVRGDAASFWVAPPPRAQLPRC